MDCFNLVLVVDFMGVGVIVVVGLSIIIVIFMAMLFSTW